MSKKTKKEFFPAPNPHKPVIYGYILPQSSENQGYIKIGYTSRNAKLRIKEQVGTSQQTPEIVFEQPAVRADGSAFTDRDLHALLKKNHIPCKGEWFKCTKTQLEQAYQAVLARQESLSSRSANFGLRPEQQAAIAQTAEFFRRRDKENPNAKHHFLWNAKMRFGKTFTAYQLAREMNWRRLLILTFKPAVASAWKEDLNSHVDFKNWQYIDRDTDPLQIDKNQNWVCFGSFQDYLGVDENGKPKDRNKWVFAENWDCIILDEYHFGSWREAAQELIKGDESEATSLLQEKEHENALKKSAIKTKHYLYLSGTPFRAIAQGEFLEEAIYNWTYADEQRAKNEWSAPTPNPYASLPKVKMLTYKLPEELNKVAAQGEYNEFDLNEFFAAEGTASQAKFKHINEVQKWLHFITARPQQAEDILDELKEELPPMPFSDVNLLQLLSHTFWFLPNVASCFAMKNLLRMPQNQFFHSYKIVVAAGNQAGIGVEALPPVYEAMQDPLQSKSITLSCGKLTTGVSVKPWSGILMLRNTTSPETYFQTAFRVQTPWTIKNIDGFNPNEEAIIKTECYVFDFAPNRALRQLAEYSQKLNPQQTNKEQAVRDLLQYLPVLAYDGSAMQEIDAAGVLEMAMSGTTATLLARRWQSAQLVNVDNVTLQKVIDDPAAMAALKNIEGFRALGTELQTFINKSENIKALKNKQKNGKLDSKEKQQLSKEEKEYKSLRKEIQEKLIKFATRIPAFMYLTDFREQALADVINQLEPELFKKVTGISKDDFNILVKLQVFHQDNMDKAVGGFKSYEDASLQYTQAAANLSNYTL